MRSSALRLVYPFLTCAVKSVSARLRSTSGAPSLGHGHLDDGPHEGTRRREPAPQEDVHRGKAQGRDCHRVPRKKVTRPSRRREMAKEVVALRGISIRLACDVFTVSESCYRYEAKRNAENEQIADWLVRLTDNNRSWGFGLCDLPPLAVPLS